MPEIKYDATEVFRIVRDTYGAKNFAEKIEDQLEIGRRMKTWTLRELSHKEIVVEVAAEQGPPRQITIPKRQLNKLVARYTQRYGVPMGDLKSVKVGSRGMTLANVDEDYIHRDAQIKIARSRRRYS